MRSLEGMSILVTGGGSGIGLGAARYCVERGARVTICGRREDKIEAAATALGDSCRGVAADIKSPDTFITCREAAADRNQALATRQCRVPLTRRPVLPLVLRSVEFVTCGVLNGF